MIDPFECEPSNSSVDEAQRPADSSLVAMFGVFFLAAINSSVGSWVDAAKQSGELATRARCGRLVRSNRFAQ
jgi:hypothetical protein